LHDYATHSSGPPHIPAAGSLPDSVTNPAAAGAKQGKRSNVLTILILPRNVSCNNHLLEFSFLDIIALNNRQPSAVSRQPMVDLVNILGALCHLTVASLPSYQS
jgi:hypothetical protein